MLVYCSSSPFVILFPFQICSLALLIVHLFTIENGYLIVFKSIYVLYLRIHLISASCVLLLVSCIFFLKTEFYISFSVFFGFILFCDYFNHVQWIIHTHPPSLHSFSLSPVVYSSKYTILLGMGRYTYNSSTWEIERGRIGVQG